MFNNLFLLSSLLSFPLQIKVELHEYIYFLKRKRIDLWVLNRFQAR